MDALPDFVKLAEAFGARGIRVEKASGLDAAIEEMLAHPGPVLMEVVIDPFENVYPMIPGGAAHNEIILSPADKRDEGPLSEEGMVLV